VKTQESYKILYPQKHKYFSVGEKVNGHHSASPDLYGPSRIMQTRIRSLRSTLCGKNLCAPFSHSWLVWLIRYTDLAFPEYRSCVSSLQITDLVFPECRSCASRMLILCFQSADPRSCVSRIHIICLQNTIPDLMFPEYTSCGSRIQFPDLAFPQFRSYVSTMRIPDLVFPV
jgi:hypothetical protein